MRLRFCNLSLFYDLFESIKNGSYDKTIRIGDEAILIKKLTNELTDGELTNDKLVEEISQNEQ